jgi:hypothetical protein
MQHGLTMTKRGFTPRFVITLWPLEKRSSVFQVMSISVKRAGTPDFVRPVART